MSLISSLFPGGGTPPPPLPITPEQAFVTEYFGWGSQAPADYPYVPTYVINPLVQPPSSMGGIQLLNLCLCASTGCATKLAALIGAIAGLEPSVSEDFVTPGGEVGYNYAGGIDGAGRVAYIDFAKAVNASGQGGNWNHLNAGMLLVWFADYGRVAPTQALAWVRANILGGFKAAGILAQ